MKEKDKKMKNIDDNILSTIYNKEYEYISKLLTYVHKSRGFDVQGTQEGESSNNKKFDKSKAPKRLFPGMHSGKAPARTVEELQARLAEFKGKRKLPYKEKLIKKGLKNRLKKKEKKEHRKMKKKLKGHLKEPELKDRVLEDIKAAVKPKKPIFNSEGKMVFSKFDFSDIGDKQEVKKVEKDPLNALKKLKKQQERMKELESAGQHDKVLEIKHNTAWKHAVMRSEGMKVKDDEELIKKSLHMKKKEKKKSAKKWKAREEHVAREKDQRQKKRMENIQARSKQKKLNKLKKAAKRGRIIAGF